MATPEKPNPEASRAGRDQKNPAGDRNNPSPDRQQRDRENPRSEGETEKAHNESNRDRQAGDPSSRQRR